MNDLRSKKRVLGICRLQFKMMRRHLALTETEAAQLEQLRVQLLAMADDMFALAACNQSDLLAARLEFGHRLIALNHIQKRKIAEVEKSSALLRSSVHRSKLREEHAASSLRQAEKFQHQKRADRHLRQTRKPDLAITRFRKGVS